MCKTLIHSFWTQWRKLFVFVINFLRFCVYCVLIIFEVSMVCGFFYSLLFYFPRYGRHYVTSYGLLCYCGDPSRIVLQRRTLETLPVALLLVGGSCRHSLFERERKGCVQLRRFSRVLLINCVLVVAQFNNTGVRWRSG